MDTSSSPEGTSTAHVPVLLHEVITVLALKKSDTVLDGTAGGGGHAEAILGELGDTGRYIGLDLDQGALARVRARIGSDPRATLVEANFRTLDKVAQSYDLPALDKILLDLGLSSDQLTGESGAVGRGFSFSRDEPLLMTLASDPGIEDLTASDVVNDWSEESLADIIFGFGGERQARKIARAIVNVRDTRRIDTTRALAELVESVVPKHGPAHPATKTFQAIRMAVNDELGALEEAIEKGIALLRPGGRMAVISFHSLEDRTVKRFFKEYEDAGTGVRITKKPLTPSARELAHNRRARSAKLRCFEKALRPDRAQAP
jgi:16S rRNA (cytosine1402-N4)-methyltransferase